MIALSLNKNNMTHTCNVICERYKAIRPLNGKRYSSGQKRCKSCSIFIKWERSVGPCCGYRLRTMPQNTEDRNELHAIKMRN